MKKNLLYFILCISIVVCFLSGCMSESRKNNVELTADQEARIDRIVQHRDEWKESQLYGTTYPVNRLHIAETDSGITFLTVSNVRDGSGAMEGSEIFVGTRGFTVTDTAFTEVDREYRGWLANSIEVDLENMSDEELRETLQEAYKKFLSKQ